MNDPAEAYPSAEDAGPDEAVALPAAEPEAVAASGAPGPAVAFPSLDRLDRETRFRQRAEAEFGVVTDVLVLFGSMLVPVLVGYGWMFHARPASLRAEVIIGAVLYGGIAVNGVRWWPEWGRLLGRPREMGPGLQLLTILTPVVTLAAAQLMLGLGAKLGLPTMRVTDPLMEAGWPVWLWFGWIALLPAWFEEIAFRGVMFTKLQAVMSPVQAMWVSAILFGILHFNMLGLALFLVPLALMGAWLTRRTGSLWPAMFIHAAHNGGVVLFEIVSV